MLDISASEGDSGPVLILAGEADLTNLAQLNSALGAQIRVGARQVTIDASRLQFADSAAIRALVATARILGDRGGKLELLHPQPAVARILELTGAGQALTRPGETAPPPGPWQAPGSGPAWEPGQVPPQDGPGLLVLLASKGSDAVLRLAGEIDITTASIAAAAADQCLTGRPARMTVDLRAVTFCDCAGGRVLKQAQQRAAEAGASFGLTGLTAPVRRVLTLMRATSLLRAAETAGHDGPDATTAERHHDDAMPASAGAMPQVPPAPPPDAVNAARRQLNQHYVDGVERLLWELDKQPIPDTEAISRAITAVGNGEAETAGPALVLLQAARLGLDRLEARALDAARAAGISYETIAAVLGLPGADAAVAWHQWLTARQTLPYEEPPPARQAVPGGAVGAAARAGHRATQAAARAEQITRRMGQLSSPVDRRPSSGREHAERSAAHSGEARIMAAEAAERATLSLLRVAEALEQCAAGQERLASADPARMEEYRQEAAWYWHTAQQYRQLAERRYRSGGDGRPGRVRQRLPMP